MVFRLQFAEQHPSCCDLSVQLAMADGIYLIQSRPEHSNRYAIRLERCAVCGTVDPSCHPAHDAGARASERRREFSRHTQTIARRFPRADDRYARLNGEYIEGTARPEMRWSIFTQVAELGRVPRIASNDAYCR
jgi:hypothetical protein